MGMHMSACMHTGTHLQMFRNVTSVHRQEYVHGFDTTSETHRARGTKAVDKLGLPLQCDMWVFVCHSPSVAACS